MAELPTGTVTFLFTDIEGSTRLLEEFGDSFPALLETHDQLVRGAIAESGGVEVRTEGDSFFVAFASASDAVRAAVTSQLALTAHPWPPGGDVRVRIGIHTGEGRLGGANYVGLDVHRAARLMSAAHGGQTVVSEATYTKVRDDLPARVSFADLGLHRLKDLTQPERVYQVNHPELPSEFPQFQSMDAHPNNLPLQLTSFVGRQKELADGLELLASTRLLTLTGPGGTGKTRLAIQVAAEAAEQFGHGVFFVPLAPISNPELVPSAMATSLALTQVSGPPLDHLKRYLRDREVLLVLDNFEHVLPAGRYVAELLHSAQSVKTMVTSRAPLHLSGEQELPVPPLPVPDPGAREPLDVMSDHAAVTLFVERASAARPHFRLTAENAPAVAAITARLDGLPLAIELAAARVRVLSPEAIAPRLEDSLALLSGGARDLPARQQTLRDTISWSYDLVPEPGQHLLARLAVFRGGAALTQAEEVCGPTAELGIDVLDGFDVLVDQSLLRSSQLNGEPRVVMLETIRDFAQERLDASGETETVRRRHALAYVALAEEAEPHLLYRDQVRWLDQLEQEHDNLRTALSWALERGETDLALRLSSALWRFWQIRGHLSEAEERLGAALALRGGEPAHRAQALEAAGGVAYWQGDMETALDLYQQSLDLTRELGDQARIANALVNLGYPYAYQSKSDPETADRLFSESLAISQQLKDEAGIAKALYGQASVRWISADWGRARQLFNESEDLLDRADEPFLRAWALYMLSNVEVSDSRADVALPLLEEGIGLFAEVGDLTGILFSLDLFTTLALQGGDGERAVQLIGATNRLRETSGAALADLSRRDLPGLDKVLDELDPGEVEKLMTQGQAMSLDEIVDYALS